MSHGEWQDMLDEIGISRAWAAKLMQIGRNPALSNVNQGLHLPASIKALYELAKLDPSDIEDGIETGHITPNMQMVPTCPRVKIVPVDSGGRRNVSTRQDAPATP